MINHVYIKNNNLLPINESILYEGVFVLWKLKNRDFMASKPTWHKKMVWKGDDDFEFLNNLCYGDSVEQYFGVYEGKGPVHYVMINSEGQIIRTNIDAQVSRVADHVFMVNSNNDKSLSFLVMPAETISGKGRFVFCAGKDIAELNGEIRKAVQKKWIKKPRGFKKDVGLVDLSLEQIKQKEG